MTRDLIGSIWNAPPPPALSASGWEQLLQQARATRLSARLGVRLALAPDVPPRIAAHLHSAQRISDALHANVRHELRQLAKALAPVGTPVVLLKGAAYVAAGLPSARGRLFSDIDILVARDRLRDVEQALFAAGWIPEKLEPYDDRYYRQWMHELPPLQHVQRHSHLDVHHTLAPPTSRFKIDGADMLACSLPINVPGLVPAGLPALRMLAPTDMVLHSALHLMQEGDFSAGLRDLLDLLDLLQHFGRDPAFWPALSRRAQELGLVRPLLHVLLQLQRRLGAALPADFVQGLRARAGIGVALTQRLLDVALVPHDPSEEMRGVQVARWLLYVRSHWLRMPWYQIAPHLVYKGWSRAAARFRATALAKDARPPR